MALKRRTKVNEAFSMASMTDVIFLLLIFFMVTSTVVIPNALRSGKVRPQRNMPDNRTGDRHIFAYASMPSR